MSSFDKLGEFAVAKELPEEITMQRLQRTAEFAYRTTPLYQQLYQRAPTIRSLYDFRALPVVTSEVIRRAGGLLACLSVSSIHDPHGVLFELNPLRQGAQPFPFTPVENETDCLYHYSRVEGILRHSGVEEKELLVLVDQANMYFAADLEDLLFNYSVTILLCDGVSVAQLAEVVSALDPKSIILMGSASIHPGVIPASCSQVLTFRNRQCFPAEAPFRVFDVYSTHVAPWLGVRSLNEVAYHSNELFLDKEGKIEEQFYLERGANENLLVTVLSDDERAPLLPLVRYDTGDKVESVAGSRFVLAQKGLVS